MILHKDDALTFNIIIMLNVNHIVHHTRAEGPGVRCCLWLQGCSIHCNGCFAKDKWSFSERTLMTSMEIIESVSPDEEGITVLGGEPFDQREALEELLRKARDKGLSTIVFTGYTYETLQSMHDENINKILSHTDILIDGPFDVSKKSNERPLVGSSNQRFIFLSDRYSIADFQPNKLEIRIKKNGVFSINGMADDIVINKVISNH